VAELHTDLSKVFSKLRDDTFSKTFPIDGKVFLLSLSGGADSVFLFHFLNFLKKILGCDFRAIHFNHQLRETESDGDEAFCSALCDLHGIDLVVYNLSFDSVGNLQDDARNARYQILKEQMSHDECFLLTGHHASDSIESFLIGFHQGRLDTRILGLQAVQIGHNILRPLVNLSKKIILEILHANKLEYRSDSSNSNVKYLRNYYRHSSFNLISNELSNIQSYLSKAEEEKKHIFASIPYSCENKLTILIKKDISKLSISMKKELFYYIHQKHYTQFMKRLDMKRVELVLSINRFGQKTFHTSSFEDKKLNVIEYSKKYEFVIV
jgi:tRNA(Ile)-lysidine synthase